MLRAPRSTPCFLVILTLAMTPAATAIPAAEAMKPGWKSDIELGAVKTNGNTQTLVINSKLRTMHEGHYLRDTIDAAASNSSDRNATTAESYSASLQEDWKITERDYLFVRYGFESDRFTGFRRRFSETGGYGRDLIKTDQLRWSLEVGGGLRQTLPVSGLRDRDTIGRAASGVEWQINDAARFSEHLSTEGGAKGWFTRSTTALQHKLNAHLASKISLELEHNSKVPAGKKRLDIETAITLVITL